MNRDPLKENIMSQKLVSHVSDTARWVATYRAWESARPDALFRDPYAERLAGERGAAIAQMMPKQARSGWPLVVRTKLFDDLIPGVADRGLRSCDQSCRGTGHASVSHEAAGGFDLDRGRPPTDDRGKGTGTGRRAASL